MLESHRNPTGGKTKINRCIDVFDVPKNKEVEIVMENVRIVLDVPGARSRVFQPEKSTHWKKTCDDSHAAYS